MATFYAKIVTANEFLMIIMVMIEVQKVEADNGTVCEPGTTFLNDACFGLVDVAAGPVSYWDAEEKCADKITEGKPVSVRNKEALQIILNWAIGEGLPTNSQSGFWLGYQRLRAAPLPESGVLTAQLLNIRRDKNLYKLPQSSRSRLPQSMWRNETQPGNALDERDERCTAQSRPGRQPEFLGADDYECNGTTLHYTVCQGPTDWGARK
ncbi:uncharacterized protein LOC142357408 [Convolutriloba macropyga]|uniref:uncharacterized protein LOC142357408 n=1 Tax=Convolutriloba macropyga TaxID=536237 RepID=UPI003F5238D5